MMHARQPKIDVKQVQGRFQITINDPQTIDQTMRLNDQLLKMGMNVQLLKNFKNRGKFDSVKFSFQQNKNGEKEFTVSIIKSKFANKNLAVFCQELYEIWLTMLKFFKLNVVNIHAENNKNQGPKIQIISIDALSIQFCIAQPQYYNKKVYFKYSDLQFNCNIPSVDKIDKYTEPHLLFSFTQDDYDFYKSPRLIFLDEFSMAKFQQSIKNLKQNFMIGLTLYNFHFYLNILEEQQKKIFMNLAKIRNQYQKDRQSSKYEEYKKYFKEIDNSLYKNLQLIKVQFHRKVCMNSILTSLGKLCRFKITLQHDQRQREKEANKQLNSQYSIIVCAEKNVVSVKILEGMTQRKQICLKYVEKYKNLIEGLNYIQRESPKEAKIQYQYRNRAYFEFFIISFELFCFSLLDRQWKTKHPELVVESRNQEIDIKYNKNLIFNLSIGRDEKTLLFVYQYKAIKCQNLQKIQKCQNMFSNYLNNCLKIWNLRDFIRQFCEMCDLYIKIQLNKQQQGMLKKVLMQCELSACKKICRVNCKKEGQQIIVTLAIYDVKMTPTVNAKIKYELSKDKQKVLMQINKDRRPNVSQIPSIRKEEKLKDFLQSYKLEKSLGS